MSWKQILLAAILAALVAGGAFVLNGGNSHTTTHANTKPVAKKTLPVQRSAPVDASKRDAISNLKLR